MRPEANCSPPAQHLEQAVALYEPERHGSTAFVFGQDLGVSALAHLTWVLWLLGYPDQASRRQAEGLALAHRVGHKNTLGFALMYSAMVGTFGRDASSAAEHAATLLELSREHKLDLWAASATVVQGWAMARQGQGTDGLAVIQRGLEDWRNSGAEWMRPFFLGLLAEACALSGDVQRGLDALDEALAAVERTGERWPEAELHRLRGQLLAALPDGGRSDEASAAFERAIESRPPSICEVLGAPGCHQPRPALARPRQTRRGSQPARARVRGVHRGLWDTGCQRGQGTARHPEVTQAARCR